MKTNVTKSTKSAKEAAQLTEQQLQEKIEAAKQDRLKKFLEVVQKAQEEYKCALVPALGGQPLTITIQNQPLTVVAIPV